MNFLLFEYKNFYHCQFHHKHGYFLNKVGWWETNKIWMDRHNSYTKGNGDEVPEKYDTNLIFTL